MKVIMFKEAKEEYLEAKKAYDDTYAEFQKRTESVNLDDIDVAAEEMLKVDNELGLTETMHKYFDALKNFVKIGLEIFADNYGYKFPEFETIKNSVVWQKEIAKVLEKWQGFWY